MTLASTNNWLFIEFSPSFYPFLEYKNLTQIIKSIMSGTLADHDDARY
ncbi:hypothetical protein CZ794_06745 [Psychrobacter sp. JB385]|nr:hypothetical protein CZ794_06745 [Psychrobacter sp. JB385]